MTSDESEYIQTFLTHTSAKNKLTSAQWASICSIPIALLWNIFYKFGLHSNDNDLFVSLSISLAGIFAAERWAQINSSNRHMLELKMLTRGIKDLQYIGDSTQAIEWVRNHMGGLIYAYNTVYRPRGYGLDHVLDHIPDLLSSIRHTIRDGCHWTDLVFGEPDNTITQLISDLRDKERQRYTCYKLVTDMPLFQALLLRYKNDPAVVLFGWAYKGTESPIVFKSSDPATFSYFESYYRSLASSPQCKPVYVPNAEALPKVTPSTDLIPPPAANRASRRWPRLGIFGPRP